jgi:hypothetical protein
MLAALVASAVVFATEPAAPGAPRKTVAAGHSKPGSFAPQSRPAHRAYGAPIQKPILAKRKRRPHRPANPAAAK